MSPIDIYKYPGEDVLRNKFDCHDNNELQRLETFSTAGNIFSCSKILSKEILILNI